MTRGRRLAFAVLSLALALLAAGLLFPLAGRLLHPPMPPDTPGLYRKSADPDLEWGHVPNWTGTIAGATVHINLRGDRGPDLSGTAEGVTRIVTIGDSIAFGQGVRDDETLAMELARQLEQKTGRRFEGVNAGVRGYAARQYPAALRRALGLSPRLAVLTLTLVNDPEREKWEPRSERMNDLKNSLLARIPGGRMLLASAVNEEIRRLFVPHVQSLYEPTGREWHLFLDDLAAVKKVADDAGLPLVALIFPPIEAPGMFSPQERQLEDALDRLGIRWVNPEDEFRPLPLRSLAVSDQDFHPGPRAIQIMARALVAPALQAIEQQ